MSNPNIITGRPAEFVYRGGRLPNFHLSRTIRYATTMTVVALIASAALVYAIYFFVDPEGIALAIVVTLSVTCLVAFPLSLYYSVHRFKLYRAMTLLDQQARYDDLSGLLNRATFVSSANEMLCKRRGRDTVSILYLDADHFKMLNDSHGHELGDRAIELIGEVIAVNTRKGDLAGRIGGEEFSVLLSGEDALSAEIVATRLVRTIEAKSMELGLSQPLTVSVGLATSEPGESFRSVCRRADAALYAAKERGRNRVECHDRDMQSNSGRSGVAA